MSNPFKYGCIVTGKYFCDRPKLLTELSGYIKSGQNIVIFGERRIGKSSAIAQAVLQTKGYSALNIDLWGIRSINDLIKRIIKSIFAKEKNRFSSIFSKLASIRPNFSFDSLSGLPTVGFDASLKLEAESIIEAIGLINELYGKKKIVIVMDEFQDILNIEKEQSNEVLGILRSNIQHQTDIPYFFVGSIRKEIESIFLNPKSPFFNSAIPIEIKPLDKDRFMTFIKKRMKEGKRTIDNDVLLKIFEIANNITGDVQKLCEAIWSVSEPKEKISDETFQKAIKLIFSREGTSYQDYTKAITANQYKCLVSIAKNGGKNITAGEFVISSGIKNSSSLLMAANSLVSKNILFRIRLDRGIEYRFVNPFFRAWLIKNE